MEGVDYSGGRPSALCLRQHGKHFAGRYFGPGSSWKHASKAECRALLAAGLSVMSLVEGAGRDALKGRATGREHAELGIAAAIAAGMPADRPLIYAVDFDAQPHQLSAIASYLHGCADVTGAHQVGVYGSYGLIEWAHREGLAKFCFQTYAWSRGLWSRYANVQQYRNNQTVCGARVDLCRSISVDFGQWPAPTQSIGNNPIPPDDSTVDTGWDYTAHVDSLAAATGSVADVLSRHARAINALSDG